MHINQTTRVDYSQKLESIGSGQRERLGMCQRFMPDVHCDEAFDVCTDVLYFETRLQVQASQINYVSRQQ